MPDTPNPRRQPAIHVLVCTNERPADNPKGCCAHRGSIELYEALRRAIEARSLRGKVQVNRTNCLKPCGFGPTVVVYPQGDWYGRVSAADVDDLLEAALAGSRLERLVLPPEARTVF